METKTTKNTKPVDIEFIDLPTTNEEHLRYALKGVEMVLGSTATLAWRGAKAVYKKAAEVITCKRNARNGKEGVTEDGEKGNKGCEENSEAAAQ